MHDAFMASFGMYDAPWLDVQSFELNELLMLQGERDGRVGYILN